MAETVYYGVVQGNAIVLPTGIHLADGERVEIRPLPAASQNRETLLAEDLLKQDLLEAGLLSEIKTPESLELEEEFVPIHIQGTPLSESILADRR